MKSKIQLDNGLVFISDDQLHLHTISISLFFKAGTYYEDDSNYGISHLVEHLFFRQLYDLSQQELYRRMGLIGATLRGRTFRDFVCFDISVVPVFFNEAIDLVLKLLQPFTWTIEQIQKEKEVVKKQIEAKSETYDEYVEKRYFGQKVYEVPVMGYAENICGLTPDQINLWKEKFFHCKNACLVICGAFTQDMQKQAENRFRRIENSGPEIPMVIIKPRHQFNRQKYGHCIIPWDDTVSDVWITFDSEETDFYKLQILSCMLAGGVGSRLSYLLTDTYALTELIVSRINLYNGFSNLIIEYSVSNKDVMKSLELLFGELFEFKKQISIADFSTSIPFFTYNLRKQLDRPSELGFDYGWYDFILNRKYKVDSAVIDTNQKLTIAELQKTATELFAHKNMVITIRNNAKIIKRHTLNDFLEKLEKQIDC